jgi:cytidylate kinase
LIIAIDGPAGSGKSTVAREVARHLQLPYIDTGAMYRAVALAALQRGIDPGDQKGLAQLVRDVELRVEAEHHSFRVLLDGADVGTAIRGTSVDAAVSHVARCAKVREAMVRVQRELARPGGAVIEGRDIGTVVFPDATVKIYLDASAEERARRRSAEKENEPADRVATAIRQRDRDDRGRERSPLRPAQGAVHIDSTNLSVEEVVDRILGEARRAKERMKDIQEQAPR